MKKGTLTGANYVKNSNNWRWWETKKRTSNICKLKGFIKEKLLSFTVLVLALFTILVFLIPYNIEGFIAVYILAVPTAIYLIFNIAEYINKKSYYDTLESNLNQLEEKYLISEIIPNANFQEGKILKETLRQTNKAMIENVNKYKFAVEDYKDYIEMWIHEIKIPIATSKLIIENNKTDITKSIDEEYWIKFAWFRKNCVYR